MVWIHGGGFISGSTGKDFQSPDYILDKDLVYVALAYRLGIFGFLSLKDPSLKVPGNAGLKDLVLGLKWVKANISRFGGDPDNITIFGLSAGGAAVHYLGLTEQTKGLFHRMIAMSGAAFCPWGAAPVKDWGQRVAKALGYKGNGSEADILQFLRSAKCKKITGAEFKSITKDESHSGLMFTAYPVVEPYITEQCVLPQEPIVLARTAWTNDIPVITGCTSREGIPFPQFIQPGYVEAWKKDPTMLLPFDLKTDPNSDRCMEIGQQLMKRSFGDENFNQENIIDVMSYCHFVHPMHRMVLSRQKHAKAPTYLYIFDFDSPKYNLMKKIMSVDTSGVSHGDDIGYLFFNLMSDGMPRDCRAGEIRELYVSMLTKFATDNDPVCPELGSVKWEPVNADDQIHKCLRIADKVTFEDNPFADILMFWDELYEEGKLI